MKHSDAIDPLNEKEFNDKQPVTESTEPLKEEKETTPDQAAQGNEQNSPAGKKVAESSDTTSPEPVSESDSEPTLATEPAPTAEPAPASEPETKEP